MGSPRSATMASPRPSPSTKLRELAARNTDSEPSPTKKLLELAERSTDSKMQEILEAAVQREEDLMRELSSTIMQRDAQYVTSWQLSEERVGARSELEAFQCEMTSALKDMQDKLEVAEQKQEQLMRQLADAAHAEAESQRSELETLETAYCELQDRETEHKAQLRAAREHRPLVMMDSMASSILDKWGKGNVESRRES